MKGGAGAVDVTLFFKELSGKEGCPIGLFGISRVYDLLIRGSAPSKSPCSPSSSASPTTAAEALLRVTGVYNLLIGGPSSIQITLCGKHFPEPNNCGRTCSGSPESTTCW